MQYDNKKSLWQMPLFFLKISQTTPLAKIDMKSKMNNPSYDIRNWRIEN